MKILKPLSVNFSQLEIFFKLIYKSICLANMSLRLLSEDINFRLWLIFMIPLFVISLHLETIRHH